MEQYCSRLDSVCPEVSALTGQLNDNNTKNLNQSINSNQLMNSRNSNSFVSNSHYQKNFPNLNYNYNSYNLHNQPPNQPSNQPYYNLENFNQPNQYGLAHDSLYAKNQMQSYPYHDYLNYNKYYNNNSSPYNAHYNQPYSSYYPYYNNNTTMENDHLNASLQAPHPQDLNKTLSLSLNNFSISLNNKNNNFPYVNPNQTMDQISELQRFVIQYKQWWDRVNFQKRMLMNPKERLTPLKFPSRHSRVHFGGFNQLIIISGNSITINNIKPTLIESNKETLIFTWPGPLIKNETNKLDLLEYIKSQESKIFSSLNGDIYGLNSEKVQLWQLLSIMVKQNGLISSSELAEFLISNNESEFQLKDNEDDISKFRHFLLLGQRKTALDFSRRNELWGHRFSLTYLISSSECNEIMINCVNDFIDSSIPKDDPIFTLFTCLLQDLKIKNGFRITSKNIPPSNLQQFTILLANDCEISPVIAGSTFVSEVLKLIVALRNKENHFISLKNIENFFLKYTKFSEYSDEVLFMNEILEFCQTSNLPLLELIPFKVIFATKLFDFGFIDQAKKYCEAIRNVFDNLRFYKLDKNKINSINWDLIFYIIDLIENKIERNSNYPSIENSVQTSPILNSSQLNSSPITDVEDFSEQTDLQLNQLDANFHNLNLNRNNKDIQEEKYFSKNTDSFPPIDNIALIPNTRQYKQRTSTSTTPNQLINQCSNEDVNSNNLSSKQRNNLNTFKPIVTQNFFVPKFEQNIDTPKTFDFVSNPNVISNNYTDVMNKELVSSVSQPDNLDLKQPSDLNSTMAVPPHQNFTLPKPLQISPTVSPIQSPSAFLLKKNTAYGLNDKIEINEVDNAKKYYDKNKLHQESYEQFDTLSSNDKLKDKKSFFRSFTSKLPNLNWQTKSNQAILPDDSEERFYYNEELKTWVDKLETNETHDSIKETIKSGPPKNPFFQDQSNQFTSSTNQEVSGVNDPANLLSNNVNHNQYSFMRNLKKQRYVGIASLNNF